VWWNTGVPLSLTGYRQKLAQSSVSIPSVYCHKSLLVSLLGTHLILLRSVFGWVRAYVRDSLGRFYPRLVRASFSIETRAARASSGVPTGAGNARRTGRGASAVMADISNP